MKRRRFSDQELYSIRNHIPIQMVIKSILCVPSQSSQGIFRFRCPLCSEFNTAINPQTNLARCFLCEKNFNAIDMVMAVREINFIQAVNLLKKNLSHNEKQIPQNNTNPYTFPDPYTSLSPRRSCKDPVAIGDICSQALKQMQNNHTKPNPFSTNASLSKNIAKLEQDIQLLSQQIKLLKTIILNNQ